MILTSLSLTNFRNFTKKEFGLRNLVTVVVGPNTIGKTSILEAIFYLATGKSNRADQDREVVQWGTNISRVSGEIHSKDQRSKIKDQSQVKSEKLIVNSEEKENLEIVFTDKPPLSASGLTTASQGKKFLVNGVARRMVDFAGICKAVLFRPEDLELITDSPSLRRRYLDFVLTQVDREYRRALISYEKGIRQRNRLLEAIRDEGSSRSQLLFWDQLLIKNGNYISDKRKEYLEYLNNIKSKLGCYGVVYDDSQISVGRLAQYAEAEIAAGVTLVGPHRDNFVVKIKDQKSKIKNDNTENISRDLSIYGSRGEPPSSGGTGLRRAEGRDLSIYGSRGEQRLAILWLKMGEMEFIEKMTGERPILLLDDIFSELDHPHRKLVMEIVGKQQTIITTADKHYIEGNGEMEIVEL